MELIDIEDYSGLWFIEGVDLYTNFGITIDSGLKSFNEYPSIKPPVSKNWPDQNGVEYDYSQIFFDEKSIDLTYTMHAPSKSVFWQRHNNFFSLLTGGDTLLKDFYITKYGRLFFIMYQSMSSFNQITTDIATGFVVTTNTIKLKEPIPSLNKMLNFLMTEDGVPILTEDLNYILST